MTSRLKQFLLVAVLKLFVASAETSDSSTSTTPILFEYDDIARCHQSDPPASYCFTKIVIETDEDPINSTRIVVDYRRNVLERGLCVAACERELAPLGLSDRQRLYYPKFNISYTYTLSMFWESTKEPYIRRYGDLLNVCNNHRLKQTHNTTGYTEIEYCTAPSDDARIDWWRVAFASVLLLLIGTILLTNAIDLLGSNPSRDNLLVSSFSIRRNWARLIQQPNSDLGRDFAYIDGLRVIINVFVLFSHIMLSIGIVPTVNPEAFEQIQGNPVLLDVCSIVPSLVKIFFCISGLLLTLHFLEDVHKNAQLGGFKYFRNKIVYRLIRLLPVYYFFLLHATVGDWIPGVELGVMGYKGLTTERNICREYAWANLLFVNSMPFVDALCMAHTWYLGTDMQLFLGGLVILAILWKWPRAAKPVFWMLVTGSLLITCSLVYYEGIEPVFAARISEAQSLYLTQRYFREMYMPSYTNMWCFVSGMVVGHLYHYTKHHEFNVKHSTLYKLIKTISLPMVPVAMIPAFLFYQYEFSYRSIWVVLYSLTYGTFAVLFTCVRFVENMQKPPGCIRRFLSSQPMILLGKASYCVYIVHPTNMRISACFVPLFMEASFTKIVGMWIALAIGAYATGVVVCLCLEQPMGLLLRKLYDRCCAERSCDASKKR